MAAVALQPPTVILFSQATANGAQTSDKYVERGEFNGIQVELVCYGAGTGSITVQLLDSHDRFVGYSNVIDSAGLKTATGTTKFYVASTLQFVKAQITVTSGTWDVRATAMSTPSSSLATVGISGTTSQDLTGVGGAAISLGPKPSASSLPVVLATDEASVPVQSTVEQQVRAGTAFVWGPGKLAVGAAANGRILISNPNGSGKSLFIYAHALSSDTAGLFLATLFRNPTAGLPALGGAGVGIVNQLGGSATASVAEVGADTNATPLSGGTTIGVEAVVGVGRTAYPAALYVVPPNSSLGFDLAATVAAGFVPEFTWWEA